MDAYQDQMFGYVASPADLSYSSSSSQPVASSAPNNNWLFDPLKFNFGNSPSSHFASHLDFEANTPLSGSPDNQHSSTENNISARESPSTDYHYDEETQVIALRQLESVLLGSDDEEEEAAVTSLSHGENKRPPQPADRRSLAWSQGTQDLSVPQSRTNSGLVYGGLGDDFQSDKRHKAMEGLSVQGVPPGNLKHLLVSCAKALSDNRMDDFVKLVRKARESVSVTGEPIQRVGAYMVEGLVARRDASGTNIYKSLKCKEPQGKDLLSYMHVLYEICPYLKFGYMAANGAIAEACRNEDRIHIIDFQICQGTQWMTLLQALAARPGGPPHVRITGIDDPVSKHARGDTLEAVGHRLAAISDKFKIPIEFHPVPVLAPDVNPKMLNVIAGEALAVNFPLVLHHIPDESVDVDNPRDRLLRTVKSMNPKVVTLVEQESNTNTPPFLPRFMEALDYYLAMFESIDVAVPRDRKERINAEEHCLARDLVNVIACEGRERVERHELLGKWRLRFMMAGFRPYPLSSYVNSVISKLLKFYSENYRLTEKDGGMLLAWKDRNLVSASAWH
ncbi:scarecrow-like protein 21 [Impatiens glandulifera]|uniref:scarecrow-like protein 21 n=1 Tax=Impatiens glandulifera TaxID=253017 RepID=UPI001FB0FC22|nr:scarecrow-like protein 21 [Impatiens glandulifera]